MNAVSPETKLRWVVSGTAAAVVIGTLALLFRLPSPPLMLPASGQSRAEVAPTPVQMARATAADTMLKEETEIRDLRPLFLPTEFNATRPEPRREMSRSFLDGETLKLGVAEADLNVSKDLPVVVALNDRTLNKVGPADAVAAGAGEPPLVGFGRRAAPVEPVADRGGFLEVVATSNGHTLLAERLPPEARPPGDKAWEPMEFLAVVNPAGLAAPLVVTASSRVEEVDAYFRNFLARQYRIGARLPPGFYRVVVGP